MEVSACRVEWRPLAACADIVDAWHDLANRALEPNVFYEPAFALAAATAFGRQIQVALIWSRSEAGRLLGFFPGHIDRWRYGLAAATFTGWTNPYAPLGTPLVDAIHADAVIAAWVDRLSDRASAADLVLLPLLPTDGPFAAALERALGKFRCEARDFSEHRRALLDPGADRAGYLDRTLGHKNRKELPRKRRRLAELGTLVHEIATNESDVALAFDEFLRLEASGWKGRAGTAAAQHAEARDFMRAATVSLAREGKARIDLLRLDDRVIAAMIGLRSQGVISSWKIAYDEEFSRFSPGVQLVLDFTADALNDARIARVDSCAAGGHPMIDHVWGERLAMADRLINLRPERNIAFMAACKMEALRRSAIASAKALRNRLRAS